MADNYILEEQNINNMALKSFQGLDIHAILTFIKENYNILNNKICMFSAKIDGDNNNQTNTVLTTQNWILQDDGIYNKKVIITNIPLDFDYSNVNVNFIIAPTEDKGYKDTDTMSEESSSMLYSNSVIRCNEYLIDSSEKQVQLTFLADDILEYNIYLNILVLYKPKNNFEIINNE